ncbi:hypothetical protein [Mycobacterium sp. 155]|nr:hypothetical protein [Mycobacterium sp. 155]
MFTCDYDPGGQRPPDTATGTATQTVTSHAPERDHHEQQSGNHR